MTNVTDKYHLKIDDETYHNQLFDLKKVSKKAYQLGIASLFLGVGISIYDACIGLYVSSFLVACFCFALLMFIVLKYNEVNLNLPLLIIVMVCGMLIASVLLEGLQGDQYLLFFPTLFAAPILIDYTRTRYGESFLYLGIILLSFVISVAIGRTLPAYETFNQVQINQLALMNRIVAISSTIIFAISYSFIEQRYIKELVEQSKRVINIRTQFLATMGHELRTPLNGIIGTLNLLKETEQTAKNREFLTVMQYCSDHMLQQVNDILDYNKLIAGKHQLNLVKTDLSQLLTHIGLPFVSALQEKGLELITDLPEDLKVAVLADELKIVQVLNNLLAHALKFTDNGYIKVAAKVTRQEQQVINILFTVEDTGMAISPADQKKILEVFGQVYDERHNTFIGTGLGLNTAQRLLRSMGSLLTLSSQESIGSKFSFEIQFETCPLENDIQTKAVMPSLENLSNKRVLLVEDNPINLMVAKKTLTRLGANVVCVTDGQQALDKLDEDHSYDVVLMDLEMPVLNGYQAILEIKKKFPALPVLAFTASLVDEKMSSDLIKSGFVGCLLKPFSPADLLHAISAAIAISC